MIPSFAKPEKVLSTEAWKGISADGAPPGVYVSNMSSEDRKKWKAKLVGTKSGDHQIEIRKMLSGTNLVLIVNGLMPSTPEESLLVKMSANGPGYFYPYELKEFELAIQEARDILKILDRGSTSKRTYMDLIRAGKHPLFPQESL